MGALDGRTALVTGGGSGIGLGTAQLLARDGAIVTICGRTEDKLLKAVADIGGQARSVVADVTDEAQISAAVDFTAEPTGRLDMVFANAGGSLHMGPVGDATAEAFRATVDLNLT